MKPKIDLLSARNRSTSSGKNLPKKKLSLFKDLKHANNEQQPQQPNKKNPLQKLTGCLPRQE